MKEAITAFLDERIRNWIPRRRVKTLKETQSVRVTTFLRQAFKYLIFRLIKRFAVWYREKETNIMASRMDFIDKRYFVTEGRK